MATTIDQKVVEMKFDNRDFEKNTKQTMSTLDKLKAKLHFKGASDGLEEVSKAARKVNMNGLADGIQTVSAKFSAMEVIGTTALVNITNSAINAGKNMVKSLTVDQVTSGWTKMNQKISSVQTLVNSTGLSVDEIDEYLSQLMWYSDETSYSFTDMTAALANMTATGGDIKKLVPMIRGMANATAYAGKGAAEFSRVIYNLNQSYGSGALTLMDWKSVQLAGVNSKQLTQELIKAGEELGTIKKGQVTIANFNDSLKDKWATTKVMETAFGKFDKVSEAAYKAVQQGYVEINGIKTPVNTASEAIELLSDQFDELSLKAFRSAQEAKSFSEAIDATADASSSAWMEIFSAIFGNYERQKQIFTDLANWLYEVFVEPIYKIEEVVRNAFDFSGFETMWNKLTNNSLFKTMESVTDAVKGASRSLEEYQGIVSQVWRGDFNNRGDNPDRFDLLTKAGWDPRVVQDLVNKTDEMAGYGKGWTVIGQLTIDDVRKSEEKYGISVTETTKAVDKQVDTTKDLEKQLKNLTEEQLEKIGLNEEEIRMYQSLQRASDKYGVSMTDIINKMQQMSGRDLVFGKAETDDAEAVPGIFQNIAGAVGNFGKAIGQAWKEVFSPFGGAELYMAISNLHEFTVKLREATENETTMRKFTDTFKGLFAVLKLVTQVVGGGFKIAWTIFKTVLETLGYDVLDFTAAVGNLVSTFAKFITDNNYIVNGIVWLTKTITNAIVKVHNFAKSFFDFNEIVNNVKKFLKSFALDLKKFLEGLKETDNVPKYIMDSLVKGFKKYGGQVWDAITGFFDGLLDKIGAKFGKSRGEGEGFFSFGVNIVKGLKDGVKSESKGCLTAIIDWAAGILQAFADKMQIHSPSKEFFYFGVNIVKGLYNGIASLVGIVYNLLTSIGTKMIDIVQNMDFGALLITSLTAGVFTFALAKVGKIVNIFAKGIEGINGILEGAQKVMKSFSGVLNALKFKIYIDSIKSLATAILMLVGCVVVLSLIDEDKMWRAIDGIWSLIFAVSALMLVAGVASKMGKASFAKLATTILALGLLFFIAGTVIKKLGRLDKNEINQGMGAMIAFVGLIVGLMAATKLLSGSKNVNKFGDMMIRLGVAFYLMSMAVKKLGKLSIGEVIQGTAVMVIFGGLVTGLMAATLLLAKNTKSIEQFGNMMLKMGVVFYLMSMVVKKLGRMDPKELAIGMGCITAFAGIIVGLMAATKLIAGGKNVEAIGKTIQAVGTAILLMALSVKLLGGMEPDSLIKGGIAVGAFIAMILGLVYGLKKIGGKDIANINSALIGISLMIMSMALSCALLSLISWDGLEKGLTAVGFISLFVSGMIMATKDAKDLGGTFLKLAASIAILVGCVVVLSLLDPTKMATSTLALSMLMGMFALMIHMSKTLEGADPKKFGINLAIMTGVIAALAGIVILLGKFAGGNALQSATAVTLLAGALVGILYALDKIGKINVKELLTKIGVMAALMVVLTAAIIPLKMLGGTENLIQSALSLVILIGGLTVVMFALSKMGTQVQNALLGVAGLLGLMVVLAAAVGVLALMSGIQNGAQNAIVLAGFISVLTIVLLLTAAVGAIYTATAGIAATGLLGLLVLVDICALLIPILSAMNGIENAEANCTLLINLMTVMGDMLFKIGIIGPLALMGVTALGALMLMMPILIAFAVALGALFEKIPALQGFLDTGLPIMIQVAGAMGEMIGAFVSGALTQISSALPEIGANLSLFMLNATPFIVGMEMVNGQTLKGTGIMAGCILALTAADVINGIASFFTGGFAELGTELSQFAINALPFLMTMSAVPPAAMQGVKALAQAVLCLTAANILDGLSRFFGGGGSSLAAFGQQLGPLGTSMNQFVTNLGVFSDEQVATVDCAGQAITALAEASKKLPKSGGWAQKLFGEGSLKDFAEAMPGVADGVVGFVKNLGTFGDDQIKTSNAACEVIRALAEAAKVVGSDGGFWQGLFGSKNDGLAKFAKNMPDVGKGVKGFIDELKDVKDKADVAEAGANIINGIAKLADIDFKKANDNLPKFGDTMNSYGGKLKTFIENLKSFSKEDVETANGNLTLVTTAAQNMINTVNNGINDNSGSIATNMSDVCKQAANAISSDEVLGVVKGKGKDFVQGFADGINNNKDIAYQAALAMGKKSNEGLSKGINSHSPSKEAELRGEYFGEGFVIGIDEYSSKVYKVSESVGNEAKRGLSAAIAKVSSLVESGIDASPTIRPVLDLSEVSDGAGYINSMFGNPSMQLAANLNSISSGMKSRIQNGNSDVVSAIDKLGKNLGNGGNTYNFGGITYSDDSPINNAIKELIRAVDIERRV